MSFRQVLTSLHLLLDNCSLKRNQESLEATVTCLVDLTQLETQFADMSFSGDRIRHQSGPGRLAVNGYTGLQKICTPLHGSKSVHLVFQGRIMTDKNRAKHFDFRKFTKTLHDSSKNIKKGSAETTAGQFGPLKGT